MLKNTNNTYGSVAKFFHWFMMFFIICLLILGSFLKDLNSPQVYYMHKTIGFAMLIMLVFRLIWRLMNPTPAYNANLPKWMHLLAHLTHYTFYLLIFCIVLSGFFGSNASMRPVSFLFMFDMPLIFKEANFALSKFLFAAHGFLASALICLICAHVGAALYHHFIRKDDVLINMLPNSLKNLPVFIKNK